MVFGENRLRGFGRCSSGIVKVILLTALVAACASSGESADDAGRAPALPVAVPSTSPEPGTLRRVGGDLSAIVKRRGDVYRVSPCVIDTPLPDGYPDPTPPGAIDLKTYPSVRRAVVTGTGTPNRGMDRAFWPLFNHIRKKSIAMTSPVEMDYIDAAASGEVAKGSWSMAFLYRSPELNVTGVDGGVKVVDAPPVTVVAIGMKGDYGTGLVERGARKLEDWLAANPDWEAAGPWRSLYYNGPSLDFWNKWAEVQIPVRPRLSPAAR